MYAGFAEVDLSPPMGTLKIGWIKRIVIDERIDPIFARVAVFVPTTSEAEPSTTQLTANQRERDERESLAESIAFVQLDFLFIRPEEVTAIRERVSNTFGFPGERVMVSASHNHAGPAVADCGDVPIDETYTAWMVDRVVECFGKAFAARQPASVGAGFGREWRISHNRRMVMRDGTVQTHTGYGSPDALYMEGPIDPEVAVVAARSAEQQPLGAIVNFACHPTHHGGDGALSAGYPGVLAREMKARGVPVILFLNGACGNLSPGNPAIGADDSMETMGRVLADDAGEILNRISYHEDAAVGCRSVLLDLPYRAVTDEETAGTIRGAQRFIDPAIYDRHMADLVDAIQRRGMERVELQALSLAGVSIVGVPAEFFTQLGLSIKERCHPKRVLVASCTNGIVGYIPHRDAFKRGGYETTFWWGSKMAHEAGDLLVDRAVALLAGDPA